MHIYSIFAIILTLAVLMGYINHRFIRMQTTIAIMAGSLVLSFLAIIASKLGLDEIKLYVSDALQIIEFPRLLMHGMLSFLLFAGALNVDVKSLTYHKWEITVLACVMTIISSFIIGTLSYYLLNLLGMPLHFIECMLFGALISPTDPIAVLNTFKELGAPKQLGTIVSGESLFNDGVGIVLFTSLTHALYSPESVTFFSIGELFFQHAIGGLIYGFVLGKVASWMIRPVDDHKLAVLVTLVVVTGGYALAEMVNISGPLAMVIAGIIIGNSGRRYSMSLETQHYLDTFWEIIDEILNATLFLLIGFELLVIPAHFSAVTAAILAIPMTLAVRAVIIIAPMSLFKLKRRYSPYAISILIWGGLRGGLAVALALSLPDYEAREIILAMTYGVVLFSVLVQGLTAPRLVQLSKERALQIDESQLATQPITGPNDE